MNGGLLPVYRVAKHWDSEDRLKLPGRIYWRCFWGFMNFIWSITYVKVRDEILACSFFGSKPDSFWNICKQLHVKRLSIRRKKTRKLWKRWRPPGTSFDEERWVRYDSQCFVCICLVCFIWMLQRMPWAKNGWFYDSSLVTGYQGPVWFLYYQISAPTHSSSEVWWKQVEHEQKEMCSYLAYIWADIVTPCTYPHFLKNT